MNIYGPVLLVIKYIFISQTSVSVTKLSYRSGSKTGFHVISTGLQRMILPVEKNRKETRQMKCLFSVVTMWGEGQKLKLKNIYSCGWSCTTANTRKHYVLCTTLWVCLHLNATYRNTFSAYNTHLQISDKHHKLTHPSKLTH